MKPPRINFCHVPKTAGGSLSAWLRSQYLPNEVLAYENATELFDITDRSLKEDFSLYMGHAGAKFAKRLPEDTINIIVLRDPVDRIISLYNYFIYKEVIPRTTSIIDFSSSPNNSMQVSNLMTWMLGADFSQAIRNRENQRKKSIEDIYKEAINNIELFNIIGFNEELDLFLKRIATTFNLNNIEIGEVNKVEKKITNISKEEREVLENLVDYDFKLYSHAKKINHDRWNYLLASKNSGNELFNQFTAYGADQP